MRFAMVLFLLLPAPSYAEPIRIRSGEHDTFSRLVFQIQEGSEWTVSEQESGFEIQISGSDDGYNTAGVLDRLPRQRLRALQQQNDGSLLIAKHCNCSVRSFLWRPDRLVVDIIDEEVVQTATATVDASEVMFQSDAMLRFPENDVPSIHVLTSEENSSPSPVPSGGSQLQPYQPYEVASQDALDDAENALLQAITRAATRGILKPAINEIAEEETRNEVTSQVEPLDASADFMSTPGVGVEVADDVFVSELNERILTALDRHCLPDSDFNISAWADERPFHDQVSELSSDWVGEFGEVSPGARDKVVQVYLYFGFGAEGRMLLDLSDGVTQSRRVLFELGALIDGMDEDFAFLKTQIGCNSSAAIWSFLAQSRPTSQTIRNRIISDFLLFPRHLQAHLAPRLADRFLEQSDQEAARQIMVAGERAQRGRHQDLQVAQATLLESEGDRGEALRILAGEVEETAQLDPNTLARLLRLSWAEGKQISEEYLVLADALRHEYRDVPVAEELALWELRGWLSRLEFDRALALIDELNVEDRASETDRIYVSLAENAPDDVFLHYAFMDIPSNLSGQTGNSIARRLMDKGFFDRAHEVLLPATRQEAAGERRLLRAEVAIALGDPSAALDILQGITSEPAAELRSKAYLALENHREALAALPLGDETALMQFRAGAWERLALGEEPVFSSFAETVLNQPVQADAPTLSRNLRLLDAAEQSRLNVETLLQQFDAIE